MLLGFSAIFPFSWKTITKKKSNIFKEHVIFNIWTKLLDKGQFNFLKLSQMATSILESNRTDRYEFQVFIGQVDFSGYTPQALENAKRNVAEKSRLKTHPFFLDAEESSSTPKYTIKIVLDDVLKSDISSYDKIDREREKHQFFNDHNDSKSSDSFTNIVKKITQSYRVDENQPVCNALSLCYHFKDDSIPSSVKPRINRGVVCIFNCIPRTLITILQKNPLELTICEDLTNGRIEFGTSSITLSGPTGFTDVISYHFYEKGHDQYTHTVKGVHEVRQYGASDGVQPVVVGEISVHLKLTCHGPRPEQQQQQVDRIVLRADRPPLRPVHIDENSFDFPLEKWIVRPPPKMTYCDTVGKKENEIKVLNPEIRELLRCRSIQESLANETNDGSNRIPCSCPCKELMENVKRMLDETCRSVGQKTETAANGVDNDEIRWSSAPRPAETTLGSVRVDDSPFVAVTTVNNDDDDNES